MAGKALRKAMVQTASWAKEQERAGQQWPYCVLLMVSNPYKTVYSHTYKTVSLLAHGVN